MDDPDDYFTEDIELDEQTLAALDQAEQKYLNASSEQDIVPPPTKRLKIDHNPKNALKRSDTFDSMDLPEISLQGGTYGLGSSTGTNTNTPTRPFSPNTSMIPPVRVPLRGRRTSPAVLHLASTSRGAVRPQHEQQNAVLENRITQQPSLGPTGRPMISNSRAPIPMVNQVQSEQEIIKLQQQLEELRKENIAVQSALKMVAEEKLAKDGEVTILRKTIEKNTQNHAAQIAKLKAAKEETDMMQIQMQKDLKAEMERLKTQFIFKQQELETMSRRAPMSVRSRRIDGGIPATPITIPSQMRLWNPEGYASSSRQVQETPVRRQPLQEQSRQSPRKQMNRSPEKLKKSAMLPGFQNSFVTSTPVRPITFQSKQVDETNDGLSFQLQSPERLQQSQRPNDHEHERVPALSPELPRPLDNDGDILMNECDVGDGFIAEELDIVETIKWRIELQRLVLMHTFRSSTEFTFQFLLGLPISTSLGAEASGKYASACAEIIEVLANVPKEDDYHFSLKAICKPMIFLLATLSKTDLSVPLAAMLSLLTMLIYSLPQFQAALVSEQYDQEETPSIIGILYQLIQRRLAPANQFEHKEMLTDEVISLLIALYFYSDEYSVKKLTLLPGLLEILAIITHRSQPSRLLGHASQLLVIISSHGTIFRALLALPDPESQEIEREPPRLPYIERMCTYLLDSSRPDNESFKRDILTFFALLSISHPDAHSTLIGAYPVIQSLVIFLSRLTVPLWEDEDLIAPSETISNLISTMKQTVFLLHHLVFGIDPVTNLRLKLQHAPRAFNNLMHVFIVAFGRICYADAPNWVDSSVRLDFDAMSEMGREILELVVDGPEGDSIWEAFQIDPDEERVIDEEEMEARLMGD